jgi:hypothetical protein
MYSILAKEIIYSTEWLWRIRNFILI